MRGRSARAARDLTTSGADGPSEGPIGPSSRGEPPPLPHSVIPLPRKALAALGAAIISTTMLAGGFFTSPASAVTEAEQYEWEFVCRINSERRAWGLSDLRVTPGLRTVARNWSVQLRDGYRSLVHNPNLAGQISSSVTASWRGAGENIGWGYDVGHLHQSFMNSPSHRANILNGTYDYIGVGVATGSPDWTTHDFLDSS
ncbi:hypothetical protein B7486_64305, partial [cyanobacterium TDX16]